MIKPNTHMAITSKLSIAWFIFISFFSNAQTFPPPRNLVGAAPGPEIILLWNSPEGDSASYYNIYRNGIMNGQYLLFDSTPDTIYQYIPFFIYTVYQVTAVYEDPDGESIPAGPAILSIWPWSLPFNVTFEEVFALIYNTTIQGLNSWVKVDTASFEGQCCALLPPSKPGDLCDMYCGFWSSDSISYINLDFWAKVPTINGNSDTLKILVDHNQVIGAIHSMDQWTNFNYSIIDTSYKTIGISFRGVSAEGLGIYIDNIDIKRQTTGFLEQDIEDDNIVVYPNPANDYIFIKILETINSDINISIFDLNARIHYIQSVNGFNQLHKLDLNNLSKGIYIVRFQHLGKLNYKKLIIK